MYSKVTFTLFKMCNSAFCPSKQELELLLPLDSKCQIHRYPNTRIVFEAQYQHALRYLALDPIQCQAPEYLHPNGEITALHPSRVLQRQSNLASPHKEKSNFKHLVEHSRLQDKISSLEELLNLRTKKSTQFGYTFLHTYTHYTHRLNCSKMPWGATIASEEAAEAVHPSNLASPLGVKPTPHQNPGLAFPVSPSCT